GCLTRFCHRSLEPRHIVSQTARREGGNAKDSEHQHHHHDRQESDTSLITYHDERPIASTFHRCCSVTNQHCASPPFSPIPAVDGSNRPGADGHWLPSVRGTPWNPRP